MSNESKLYTLALAIMLGIGLIGFGGFLGWKISFEKFKHDESCLIKTDTITIFKTDTCIVKDYDTIVENVVRYKRIAIHDTAFVFVSDDTIAVPITQRWYHEDSLCDVWVSGYEPNLDSLHIVQKHTTEIIRETKVDYKMPRLTAEVGLQGLYLQDRLVGSVCAEVSYNADKLTIGAFADYTTEKKPIFGLKASYRFNLVN